MLAAWRVGCPVAAHLAEGRSPQDDEFAVLDGLLARHRFFTGTGEDAGALVAGVVEA